MQEWGSGPQEKSGGPIPLWPPGSATRTYQLKERKWW